MKFYEKIKLSLSDKRFRKQAMMVLAAMLIYYLGSFVVLPNINKEVALSSSSGGIGALMATLTGAQVSSFSIFSLGVGPIITASIVLQMLSGEVIPYLKELNTSGPAGKKKFNRISLGLALIIAVVQSVFMAISYKNEGLLTVGGRKGMLIVASFMVLGMLVLVLIDKMLSSRDMEHGVSIFIATGIMMSTPSQIVGVFNSMKGSTDYYILFFVLYILMYFAIIAYIVWFSKKNTKVPIITSGTQLSGGASRSVQDKTFLPLGWNSSGVMPIIIASSVMQFPTLVHSWTSNGSLSSSWVRFISMETISGVALYGLLIYLFTFVYNNMTVNPDELSKDFKSNGTYILGVKPGSDTKDYIQKKLNFASKKNGLFLLSIGFLPMLLPFLTGGIISTTQAFGGTSIIIMVSLVQEVIKEINSAASMNYYKKNSKGLFSTKRF